MRKLLGYISALTLLLAAGLVFCYFYLEESMYWKSIAEIESPNGELVASSFTYNSDSNRHAPYGIYVFLRQSNTVVSPKKGYVIFAGYCENNVSLKWLSNTELSIKCKVSKTESVRTLSSIAYGIYVRLESQ